MTDYKNIILKKQDGVATIILNRPEKLNAMTVGMSEEIEAACQELRDDDGVRAVVLTGAGRGFCSGADLGAADFKLSSPAAVLEIMRQASRTIMGLRELPKPVVAMVNGPAVGGGLSLTLACDIVIASVKAVFGAPQVLRNFHPDFGVTYFLPRAIGAARASDLLLTGRIIDATEAERIGIASRVVPEDKLEKTVGDIAAALAKGAPAALNLTKFSINKSLDGDLPAVLEQEARAQSVLMVMDDCKEAMAAFLEKREPRFKGK